MRCNDDMQNQRELHVRDHYRETAGVLHSVSNGSGILGRVFGIAVVVVLSCGFIAFVLFVIVEAPFNHSLLYSSYVL